MAKTTSPDKGKEITWYRDERLRSEWQKTVFDRLSTFITEEHPASKASIKWSQPVWESTEGPMIFFRGAAKHVTLGFWRGAEFLDPNGLLEGDGDRMKHLKIKEKDAMDEDLVRGFIRQAVLLNSQKGDPTKGK